MDTQVGYFELILAIVKWLIPAGFLLYLIKEILKPLRAFWDLRRKILFLLDYRRPAILASGLLVLSEEDCLGKMQLKELYNRLNELKSKLNVLQNTASYKFFQKCRVVPSEKDTKELVQRLRRVANTVISNKSGSGKDLEEITRLLNARLL